MLRFVARLVLLVAFAIGTVFPHESAAIINGKTAPEIAGENWLNSRPLTLRDLQGRVVLLEFWTYG
jgi:hypothetical protein